MAGPIFDPLNPNESPATKYQREIDAMNKRGGKRKKSEDEEFDEAYEKQQANMPTFEKLMSAQGESAGGRVGEGKKKKVVVKKRANFLGRGAGAALRGF
jgi:hypothetical protein